MPSNTVPLSHRPSLCPPVVFSCFDFGGSGVLSLDEMVLALKLSASGLCKIAGTAPPALAAYESVAREVMQSSTQHTGGEEVEQEAFLRMCASHPEISTWIAHYDDLKVAVPRGTAGTAAQPSDSIRSAPTIASGWVDSVLAGIAAASSATDSPASGPTLPLPASALLQSTAAKMGADRWELRRPVKQLRLARVYGGPDAHLRNEIHYLDSHRFGYPVQGAFVVRTRDSGSQRFVRWHDSDAVSAVACAPLQRLVATAANGHKSPSASVVVWHADSFAVERQFRCVVAHGWCCSAHSLACSCPQSQCVVAMAFSPSAALLACVAADAMHTVTVFSMASADRAPVFTACSTKVCTDGHRAP